MQQPARYTMGDTIPFLPVPKGQHLRSTSGSPTRHRHTDDILANLTPSTAVDVLRHPSGSLKRCLDSATPTEQSFALRAAQASRAVAQWLEELSTWPWPAGGGSAGFEMPTAKRRKLFTRSDETPTLNGGAQETHQTEEAPWLGSLPASDVTQYERRVSGIRTEMKELDVEEIKSHVLHHHILPLSRPSTPMSDSNRPGSSLDQRFNKMDDLAAIITAIVMQLLPNLSKLVRLMDTWSLRISVLHRIPSTLHSLQDAEVALQSGWDATRREIDAAGTHPGSTSSMLTRQDFDIMKLVVDKKVAKAARDIDFMLDTLDGAEDTIPDEWVDRMDSVEQRYGEWVATCEREMRQSLWNRVNGGEMSSLGSSATEGRLSPTKGKDEDRPSDKPAVSAQPVPVAPEVEIRLTSAEQSPVQQTLDGGRDTSPPDVDIVDISTRPSVNGKEPVALPEDSLPDESSPGARTSESDPVSEEALESYHDLSSRNSLASLRTQPSLPSLMGDPVVGSETSTVVHGPPSGFDISSDQAEYMDTAADLPQFQEPAAQSDNGSPPSSPPDFRSSTRSTSTFTDMPTVVEESPPRTPLMPSFLDDTDTSLQLGSPGKNSVTSEDDQLQQQISEILGSIPAKIKLSADPPPVNHLNPPDLQLPKMKRSSFGAPESVRSQSSMSSRAGTPSFLLAPAYARNTRSRHQKGNSEIKLYHLSRSTGEAPIKLFIRLVGENGERVMVRVGGGWADLGEYLKEYASHHSRRSKTGKEGKVEIRDLPPLSTSKVGSSPGGPASRPASALDSPITPLNVRKTRKSMGDESFSSRMLPKTPLPAGGPRSSDTPVSNASGRSRSSSRLSWTEEDSSLGMSGPKAKNIAMSEESRAWVESVKEKVRIASGELKAATSSDQPPPLPPPPAVSDGRFGEMGKVGGTKRLFRKGGV
ncbi:uncharacterized protein E0L32_009139 [Thyridium curvatum]|uniref:GAR domain-containing protein n=1 Tax=Thyridium curvatum TaxID=1093900 RepID=A0A507ASJ5_9PEZI|nr:uncharacterized protein E0L32_009139 [Thyridium curvatum]TPX09666.1 hypothetical protein E0L32_009139 [Thyridium curvatum]